MYLSDMYVFLSGPLTSSLSLTPVQSAAWSEQQQQEHREEISKKPLERSNVRLVFIPFIKISDHTLSNLLFYVSSSTPAVGVDA